MKKNPWQKMVWALALCLMLALLPMFGVQGVFAAAKAAVDVVDYPHAEQFMALSGRAEKADARTEGEWVYAVLEPENYAVILAHTDAQAKSLRVPDRLGGADVVALAAGALADHAALESVSLPGNVNAVGKGAIPAGTLVRGYHGTYAQAFAWERGYAFQSLSEFDFAEGVVDYADVRPDAFTRHSAYSLTLRELEAMRLEKGSVFFLVDPHNAYQISYYRVVSMKENGDGFVSIRCETPVTDDVLRSFKGVNEEMRFDPASFKLNEGVTRKVSRDIDEPQSAELELNFEFDAGSLHVKMNGGYTATVGIPDSEEEKNGKKSATMELREKINASVTVSHKYGATEELNKTGKYKDLKWIAEDLARFAEIGNSAESQSFDRPLGMAYAFSYAGIVTVEAHFNAVFEIKGSGTLEIVSETVTTYYGDSEGNSTKSSTVEEKKITPTGSIAITVGVKAEANLYLLAMGIFQVSGFAGAEVSASYDAVKWNPNSNDEWALITGVNVRDYVHLKAYFVVKAGIRAGLLKIFHADVPFDIAVGTEVTLVNHKLVDKHIHVMTNVVYLELLSGEITHDSSNKDQIHDSDKCPYGKASLDVMTSCKIGNQKTLLMEFKQLDAGFTIGDPGDPTEGYDQYKLGGWYSSKKPTIESRVTFPYTIKEGENVLYANILQKRYVRFIYEDGTEIAEPQYLFPGDTIVLPQTDPDRVILKWAQVESPAFLVERDTVKIEQGVTEITMPFVSGDVYLCAFEAPEINVHFYESVNGAAMYRTGSVKSKSGQVVEKPEDTGMCARYEDFGWQVVGGEEFTFPYTVPEGKIVDVSLVHFLGTKPSDDDFTWMSGEYEGSAHPPQSDRFTFEFKKDSEGAYYAIVTGRNQYDEDGNYDPSVNLVIPSQINGIPVKAIASNAFTGNVMLEAVKISSGLDYIGGNAFKNCTNLRMVDLRAEKYLLEIRISAFEGCTNLTDLRVDENAFITYWDYSFKDTGLVTVYAGGRVEYRAFMSCKNLQKVMVPSFCEYIGDTAFYNCRNLREVEIEEGVGSIKSLAFWDCTSLLELKIPDGVKCGSSLVRGCTSLETLIVGDAAERSAFEVIPAHTTYSGTLPSLKHLEIGEGYTSIGYSAFEDFHSLETVVFPESMEVIEAYAFSGTSISDVKLTGAKKIGRKAFSSNPCLQTVELTTEVMEYGAFENCPALKTVSLSDVKTFGSYAFADCVSLESVELCEGISQIPGYAFYRCESLQNLILPESISKIASYAFMECSGLQEMALPKNLSKIEYGAFSDCAGLKKITLPEGLISIGDDAFKNCSSLEELVFPDSVTQYGGDLRYQSPSLIEGCSSLRRLCIGAGYTEDDTGRHKSSYFEDRTFFIGPENHVEYVEFAEGITAIHKPFDEYYTHVETLVLPSTLESIGGTCCSATFQYFGMPSLTIHGNLLNISGSAFRYCERLETVDIIGQDATIQTQAFAETPALRSVVLSGVKKLEWSIFANSAIETAVIGDGIQTIYDSIFKGCTSLRSLRIADSVTSLPSSYYAYDCSELEELYLGGCETITQQFKESDLRVLEFGSSVRHVSRPVDSLANLERLVLPEGIISITQMGGIGENIRELVLPQSLQTIAVSAFKDGRFETVEIPAGVTTIPSEAFANNPNLKRVVIHGDQVEIGASAFKNCPQLSELVVRGSIKSIGNKAFSGCGFIELMLPDGLESVGECAFEDNEHLTYLSLPDSLQSLGRTILEGSNHVEYLRIGGIEKIPSGIFSWNGETGLQCLELGEGVKIIDTYAFQESTTPSVSFPHLETVIFPASLEKIGYQAFYKAPIRNLVIKGGNLHTIDSYAFQNCVQLESVVIESASEAKIGTSAFAGCKSLTSVQLDDDITIIDSSAFSGCSALTEIDLPDSLSELGGSAFSNCSLSRIDLPEGLLKIGTNALSYNPLTSIVIPESVVTVGNILNGCSNLKRIRIDANIDFSGDLSAMEFGDAEHMELIEFGEGITEIKYVLVRFTEYDSDRVDTIILPESLTTLKENLVSSFYGATHVKLSSSVTEYIPQANGIYYSKPLEYTTFYTNTYNEVVADIAQEWGATYVSLDGETDCLAELRVSLDGVAGAEAFTTLEGDLFSGIDLPDVPAQEGYRFTGWYYDEACTVPVQDGDRFTGDMSLYAGFAQKDVTVFALTLPRFAQMDGLAENAELPAGYVQYARHTQTAGALTRMPASPVLEGYAFAGWYVDPARYIPFDNAAAQRHPAILYGGFTSAGQGGMTEMGENGLILSDYMPTEMDGTSIVLPESIGGTTVAGIAAKTFSGLDVEAITLPAGLAAVDAEAFHGAKRLRRLSISADNAYFSTLGGVLYNKDRTVLIRYPEGIRTSSFAVPDTVRSIAPRAFENCAYLEQITLPDGLETIGESAFAYSGVRRIALPDSVTHLGAKAFEGCSRMTSFSAYGLETIGSGALPGYVSLAVRGPLLEGALRESVVPEGGVNLHYNIRYLSVYDGSREMAAYAVEAGAPLPAQAQGGMAGEGNIVYALYLDEALTQPCDLAAMPDEDVNLYAEIRPVFESESVTLESGETGCMITAYNGNGGALVLPRKVDGVSVIALGENMLASARSEVASVDIGSGVCQIADTALDGADGQAFAGTVYADAGSYAAEWAQAKGFRLSTSVYTLSFNTMGGSRIAPVQAASGALLRLTEPARTGYAFAGWYLDEACKTAAALDENGLYAFSGEDTTLYAGWTQTEEAVPAFTYTETEDGVVITGYTGEDAHMQIPASINGVAVIGIADRAFAGNETVSAVELPDGLKRIGASAFARMTKLSAITLPDSVKEIGYAAFRDCPALSAVHVGAGLESLGEQAFRGAGSLAAFTASEDGLFTQVDGVLYTDGGQTLVCCPAGYEGVLSMAQGVTDVRPYAMAESGVTRVVIPESVEAMGEGAMYGCDSLTELVIGDGAGMLYLPDRLLSGASALTNIHLGSRVWGVGSAAFFGCEALKTAYIAPEVELIDDMAFAGVSDALVITGRRGSAAQTFAQENGFTFISDAQDDVTELRFETENPVLTIGEQTTLNVTALPAMPAGETLRWTTSDPAVAHVSGGVVRALGRGTAVITVSAANGVKAETEVRVKGTPAETLALSPETLYVAIGAKRALTPIVTPVWGDTTCAWSSDDETIATVDENGQVMGVAEGETIIRAESESGCTAEAKVIVYKPVEEIRLTQGETSLTLNVIDQPTVQILAAAYPVDATYTDLVYESADETVVTVSESGLLTVMGAGTTSVTVSALYTSGDPVTLTLRVTVVPYDFSGETLPEIEPLSYSGSLKTPVVELVIGGRKLVKDTDYTMTNNGTSSLGEHTYTLTGKGLFAGTLTGTYEIVELETTVSYTGKTVFEYGSVSIYASGNATSKVKYAYALQSDPETWTDGKPKEIGDYLVRMYIPDAYGVIGSETTAQIRIIDSYIREIKASAKTIHLVAGQSVSVKIDVILEEGVDSFSPSLYAKKTDTNSVISSASVTYGVRQLIIKTPSTAEGEAEITVYRSGKAADEVKVRVIVHPAGTTMKLANVAEIREEAFVNTPVNIFQLEHDPLTIGARAFKDSAALWQIVVARGETDIAADALEGTEAVLLCPSLTAPAAVEAAESGLPYIIKY